MCDAINSNEKKTIGRARGNGKAKYISKVFVSLLKVRAGYGTSANFPLGYPVAATLNLDTQSFKNGGNFVISNSSGSVLGNPNLKPERIDEIEAGIEGRFFRSRMSLDFSIYSKKTNDLIIDRPLDPSTGYTTTQTNIGLIENRGVELDLSAHRSAWVASEATTMKYSKSGRWKCVNLRNATMFSLKLAVLRCPIMALAGILPSARQHTMNSWPRRRDTITT